MINDILDYLDFTDIGSFDYSDMSNQEELMFSNIKFQSPSKQIEFSESSNIALIGVPENRNSNCKGVQSAPFQIRKELFGLYVPGKINIIDFGNVKQGKTVKDTYIALAEVVYELLKNETEVIILGGSKDLLVPICNAYKKGDKKFNLCVVEPSFNLSDNEGIYTEENYLTEIINNNKKLFNYTNLGYQTYYNSLSKLNYIKSKFEAVRLGLSRSNMIDNEPYIRDADLFAIDINSVKVSDAPGSAKKSIHGYYGEEICKLASYAGFSDKVSSFGIFNINPENDKNNQTSELSAQIIWHFIQGYYSRKKEYPSSKIMKMKKYIVNVDGIEKRITFYKSPDTERWWVEVPYKKKKKEKSMLISCSVYDYKIASRNEIPDRWWKFFQKLN